MNESPVSCRSFAIIAAAGSGSRMGSGPSKVLRSVAGVTVLERAVSPFLSLVECCVILAPDTNLAEYRALFNHLPRTYVIPGGASRYESVRLGLEYIKEKFEPDARDIILVHDGARCFVTVELINRVVSNARIHGAAIPAVPVIDTIKSVSSEDTVVASIDRGSLRAVQTPQGFHFSLIYTAYQEGGDRVVTDDAGLIEFSRPVTVVPGEDSNIKITRPFDLILAEAIAARYSAGRVHG